MALSVADSNDVAPAVLIRASDLACLPLRVVESAGISLNGDSEIVGLRIDLTMEGNVDYSRGAGEL